MLSKKLCESEINKMLLINMYLINIPVASATKCVVPSSKDFSQETTLAL